MGSQDGASLELCMNEKKPKNAPGYLGKLSAQGVPGIGKGKGQPLLEIPLKIESRARGMA